MRLKNTDKRPRLRRHVGEYLVAGIVEWIKRWSVSVLLDGDGAHRFPSVLQPLGHLSVLESIVYRLPKTTVWGKCVGPANVAQSLYGGSHMRAATLHPKPIQRILRRLAKESKWR